MKYNSFSKILIAALALLSSCATSVDLDSYEITKTAWSAWIENNYKTRYPLINDIETLGIEEIDEGLYYTVIEQGDNTTYASEGDWVKISYIGYNLKGGIFVTRDEQTAIDEDTWTAQTIYGDQYLMIPSDDDYTDVPEGFSEALKVMSVGEKARVYIPYYLGWGTSGMSFGYGYGGRFSIGSEENFIVDMTLTEYIGSDIDTYEYNLAEAYVEANPTYTKLDIDTYDYESDEHVWYKLGSYDELMDPDADNSGGIFTGYYNGDDYKGEITSSTIMQIYYSVFTLDGDLIDTNILEDVQNYWDFKDQNTGFLATYSTSSTTDLYLEVINEVLDNTDIVGSQWCEIVCTSAWAYGEDGLVPSETTSISEATSVNDDDYPFEYYYDSLTTSLVQAYQSVRIKFIAKIYIADEDED